MVCQEGSSSFRLKFLYPECNPHCSAQQLCLFGLHQRHPIVSTEMLFLLPLTVKNEVPEFSLAGIPERKSHASLIW